MPEAALNSRPATAPTAVTRSGYVAASTTAMAAPAEMPAT